MTDFSCISGNSFTAVRWLRHHQAEENHDNSKILVCGSGSQLLNFLEHLQDIGDTSSIKRTICAADSELSQLTESRFWPAFGSRIVSWRADEYEEEIVHRTRLAAKQKAISWVVDFTPTLRRLHRLFYVADNGGRMLLFGSRQASWEWICAPLLPALRSREICVEHLDTDCHYLFSGKDGRSRTVGSDEEDLAYSSSFSSCECER